MHALASALDALAEHDPDRIFTIGGECSVSVAPFTVLQKKYGSDLAVIWIDAHPDTDTADTDYDGYHAMAVSTIVGKGDPGITAMLPTTVPTDRVALAGLHDGEPDALAHVTDWGLSVFGPDDLRETSQPVLSWLASTGAGKVAVHLDVDVVDSDEATLGLGKVPGGLTREQVRRLIDDISAQADIVGFTLAEFIPRSVLQVQEMIEGLPLLGRQGANGA
ncbi:arginase family protein [Tomitella gaofuii]|uniref:arginase family protein n=1 Tax=Tomitella gaofuii TaxID=2760083 RepID=UPI0015FB3B3C|nr:arginase family protein [Tomitella gaofuii]